MFPAFWLGLLAAALASFGLARAVARRRERVSGRQVVLAAVLGGALGLWLSLSLGVDGRLQSWAHAAGLGGEWATTVGTLALFALPVPTTALAAVLGTARPGQRRQRARQFALAYLAVVGPALLATALLPLVPSTAGLVAVAAVVGVGIAAGTPLVVRVGVPTREPTPTERATLGGATDYPLRVVDTGGRHANALAAGLLPGVRYVFVTESLLAVLPPAEAAAIVAHESAHHARHHTALRLGVVGTFVLPWLAATAADVPGAFLVGAVSALPVALGVLALARWTEYDADRYAAARVGGTTLASALQRLTGDRLLATGGRSLLALHPPVAARVARLTDHGTE